MKDMGISGAVRGRTKITTTSDKTQPRPPDLVNRHFIATRPNQLWISDFTYVATWRGFTYTAFVIDVFARRIVGWRVASAMTTSHSRTPVRRLNSGGRITTISDRTAVWMT
jgi:putative transposase